MKLNRDPGRLGPRPDFCHRPLSNGRTTRHCKHDRPLSSRLQNPLSNRPVDVIEACFRLIDVVAGFDLTHLCQLLRGRMLQGAGYHPRRSPQQGCDVGGDPVKPGRSEADNGNHSG